MQTKNIYQRINAVMKDVEFVSKGSAKVNGQYTFVSHDAVAAALHKPMAEHGIVMVPTVLDLKQDGNRTEIKLEVAFVNIDKPEDRVVTVHYGYGIDSQDKGIGKAVSYAVKYALLKTYCLETGDDVEKDSIEYKPAEIKMSAEALVAHKKMLYESVNEEDRTYVPKFFKRLAEVSKKTVDQLSMQYTDADVFKEHLSKFIEGQKKC